MDYYLWAWERFIQLLEWLSCLGVLLVVITVGILMVNNWRNRA